MKEQTKKKNEVKVYFHGLLDMRSNMLSYDELHEMMEENTVIHGANMWILMMAILIASIGLNVNSTAVIIGAMLISPLMSGILTMGYSLAIRDLPMLKHAASRFGIQVLISLVTSSIYFFLSPLNDPTTEMIARTSPTLWDVLIALFGGIAGGIGNTRQRTSNVVPGVAIATALMPPLCTAGYGLATMQFDFFFGAFYLFTINTLFIALSAFIVTKLLGVPCIVELDGKKEKRIRHIFSFVIVITVIPSILFATLTVYNSVLEKNISDYLDKEFVFSDTQLVQSKTDKSKKEISVSLVGMQISDQEIADLESRLEEYDLAGYKLKVTQNKSIQGEDSDKVTIAVQESTIQELQQQLDEQEQTIGELNGELENRIDCTELASKASEIFPKLTDCKCGVLVNSDTYQSLYFTAEAETALTSEEEQALKNWLSAESGIGEVVSEIENKKSTAAERNGLR